MCVCARGGGGAGGARGVVGKGVGVLRASLKALVCACAVMVAVAAGTCSMSVGNSLPMLPSRKQSALVSLPG